MKSSMGQMAESNPAVTGPRIVPRILMDGWIDEPCPTWCHGCSVPRDGEVGVSWGTPGVPALDVVAGGEALKRVVRRFGAKAFMRGVGEVP